MTSRRTRALRSVPIATGGIALVLVALVAAVTVGVGARASAHDDQTAPTPSAQSSDRNGTDLGGIQAETSPVPTTGAEATDGCPIMTDSIRRIYRAALGREPTDEELTRDADRYRTGAANLEDLAGALVASGVFRTAHGPLGDDGFVRLVADLTRGQEPAADDLEFWTTTLATGYPRGAVLLAFSETAAFGARTGTSPPLSGYLQWYPRGVHWYCGTGPRDGMAIAPLIGEPLYADYMFTNWGSSQAPIGLTTELAGEPRTVMNNGSLPAGYSSFRWDGRFADSPRHGDALDVRAGAETSWVVAFYPSPLGRQRIGWQITR